MPSVCRLFSLPAELRCIIYEYVFDSSDLDEFALIGNSVLPFESYILSSHALVPLLTCRQIYHEARLIAFSLVPFRYRFRGVALQQFSSHQTLLLKYRLDNLATDKVAIIRRMTLVSYLATQMHVLSQLGQINRSPLRLKMLTIVLRWDDVPYESSSRRSRSRDYRTQAMRGFAKNMFHALDQANHEAFAKLVLVNADFHFEPAFDKVFSHSKGLAFGSTRANEPAPDGSGSETEIWNNLHQHWKSLFLHESPHGLLRVEFEKLQPA